MCDRSGLFPILEDGAVQKGFVAEFFDQQVDEDPHLRRQIPRRRVDRVEPDRFARILREGRFQACLPLRHGG